MNPKCTKCGSDTMENQYKEQGDKKPDYICTNKNCKTVAKNGKEYRTGVYKSEDTQDLPFTETEVKAQTPKAPNWDKIAEGKVRHGVAIEAFKKGLPLDEDTKTLINDWVQYIMQG